MFNNLNYGIVSYKEDPSSGPRFRERNTYFLNEESILSEMKEEFFSCLREKRNDVKATIFWSDKKGRRCFVVELRRVAICKRCDQEGIKGSYKKCNNDGLFEIIVSKFWPPIGTIVSIEPTKLVNLVELGKEHRTLYDSKYGKKEQYEVISYRVNFGGVIYLMSDLGVEEA